MLAGLRSLQNGSNITSLSNTLSGCHRDHRGSFDLHLLYAQEAPLTGTTLSQIAGNRPNVSKSTRIGEGKFGPRGNAMPSGLAAKQ